MIGDPRKHTVWYKQPTGPFAVAIYLVVRAVFAVMEVFPINWNLQTARLLSKGWRLIMPKHYRRTVEHLTMTLGHQLPPEEIERMANACLESVTMFAVEAICLPRVVNALTLSRYVHLVNFDDLIRLTITGRGLILVTCHYGAFELPGHVLACLGFDVCAVMRPMDNLYLNRFLVANRRTHGLTLLEKKGASERAEDILRDGSMLAFIGDQDAGRKGMFVEFFGRPASTYRSIGLLAMRTRSPIVIGYGRRMGQIAKYEVGVERIIYPEEWDAQADPLRWITQTYTSAIEAVVRREPEQYLWIHRRWKSTPRRKSGVEMAVKGPRGDELEIDVAGEIAP